MKININVLTQQLLDKGYTIKHCDTEEMDDDIMQYLSENGLFDEIWDTMKLITKEE
jgi:hypothetical protein